MSRVLATQPGVAMAGVVILPGLVRGAGRVSPREGDARQFRPLARPAGGVRDLGCACCLYLFREVLGPASRFLIGHLAWPQSLGQLD